jgi:hypothetical protein
MKKTALLVAVLALAMTGSAQAGILELRGGVGLTSADSDSFDDRAKAVGENGVDENEFETFNADLFVNLPALPIGFGVRHEWLNLDAGGGNNVDIEARNLALLIDLRLIDTDAFYIGPIVSIGQSTADIDFESGGVKFSDRIDNDNLTYSGGLEAGVFIGDFILGAEAGYQNIEFEDSSTGSNVNGAIDASGFYGKAMIGVTFL